MTCRPLPTWRLSPAKPLPERIEVENAIRLAAENVYQGFEVVAVEQPFVLSLGRGLPPCVGVVDLILRRGKTFLVVDHKTGKRFNDVDDLQLTFYREYVRLPVSAQADVFEGVRGILRLVLVTACKERTGAGLLRAQPSVFLPDQSVIIVQFKPARPLACNVRFGRMKHAVGGYQCPQLPSVKFTSGISVRCSVGAKA